MTQPTETRTERLTYGGVSPKPRQPAIKGMETLEAPRAAAPAAATFPGFVYNGGPVISCPLVYTSFWGPAWLSDPAHSQSAVQLSQYHEDLLNSGFMNVLSQYGVGFGAGIAGAFVQASFVSNVPSDLTDSGGASSVQGVIQSCIDAGVLPEPPNPSNNALIIYLDESIGIDDTDAGLVLCEPTNDTAFGYHNFFTTNAGNPFYYAIIPALEDTCLTESCPDNDAGCSLHLSETQQQRQTQVASHEFAEMTTDPQLNAWVDPNFGENGDICNGESDVITVGANTWTVQKIYSKFDDTDPNGATFCLSQAPNPKPRLSPGPAARPAALAKAEQMAPFGRVLPLPPVRFDTESNAVSMEEQDVDEYVQKLFDPLSPGHFLSDFPGFLRQVSDILSGIQ